MMATNLMELIRELSAASAAWLGRGVLDALTPASVHDVEPLRALMARRHLIAHGATPRKVATPTSERRP